MIQHDIFNPGRMINCGNTVKADSAILPDEIPLHIYLFAGNPIIGSNSIGHQMNAYSHVGSCDCVMIHKLDISTRVIQNLILGGVGTNLRK